MQKIDNVTEFYPSISSNWKSVAVEIICENWIKLRNVGQRLNDYPIFSLTRSEQKIQIFT